MKDLTYKEKTLKAFAARWPYTDNMSKQIAFFSTGELEHIKAFISQALDGYAEELREKVGKSHNLTTEYELTICELGDCTPRWDGNYYICQFCGNEFVRKDHILTLIPNPSKDE